MSPDVVTWDELLDDYEATIAALEDVIESGAAPDAEPPPWHPGELPELAATAGHRARLGRLRDRAEACDRAGWAAVAEGRDDLGSLARIGAAARAYGSAGLPHRRSR